MFFLDTEAIISSTFVRHVEAYDSLPSTNDRAVELAASPYCETPALVVARLQTAGRGRGSNVWWSGEGALTFSLILDTARLNIAPRDWPRLSLTTALVVCDALAPDLNGNLPAIKWPNDVLIGGAKVSGILIESPGQVAGDLARLIIGVGINVNNTRRHAPAEIRDTGIAVCDVAGRPCDVAPILVRFLQSLERRSEQLAQRDPTIIADWQARSWLTGKAVIVQSGNDSIQGVCAGIDDEGALLVARGNRTERFFSGTVRWMET